MNGGSLKHLGLPVLIATMLATLAVSASAEAQVTIGQLAPTPNPVDCDFPGPFDEIQTAVAAGASYVVPASGAITSWSTNAGKGAGQRLGLKVFRPTGPDSFLVVGQDDRALAPSALNTFPVTIPVQAGDVLGLHVPGETESAVTACGFETGSMGDKFSFQEGNVAPGGTMNFSENNTGFRLNLSATVLASPALSAISGTSGSLKGGSKVVIAGANFASLTGVSFGALPATFTVDSETQITAKAPASKTLGKVPVTITTVAGTATSTTPFTYTGCKVPRLRGKKLKAAAKLLKKAGCRLGKVKKVEGASAKTGKVAKQGPKPGTLLAPGAKVKVTLTA